MSESQKKTLREEVEELLDSGCDWMGSGLGTDALEFLFQNLGSLQAHSAGDVGPDHEHDLTYHLLLGVADYLDKHGIRDAIEATKAQRKQEVVAAGQATCEAGLSIEECPFHIGSDERKWWISGYEKAEAETDDK